jgi:hypothetical protein
MPHLVSCGESGWISSEELTLQEAEAIAAHHPSVRLRGDEIDRWAARIAAEQPEEDDIAEAVLEEALDVVPAEERRRLVDSWAREHGDRWRATLLGSGDGAAAERALVFGALRAAIAERQPTPREVVAPLEAQAATAPPLAALAHVLVPGNVWSSDEARAAFAAARDRPERRQQLKAVEEVACALITGRHVERTRRQAALVRDELPFAGLPASSERLARACGLVADDELSAETVAIDLLYAHAQQLAQRYREPFASQ